MKEPFHHALKVTANYWLGTLQYTLLFILIFDAIRRITGHSFFMQYRYPAMLHTMPKNLVIFGGLAIFLITTISLYGFFHARHIYVRHAPVTIEKSSQLPGLKIALLADLHLGYNSSNPRLERMVQEINAQEPDLICFAGDTFDNEFDAIKDPETAARILAGLTSRYGVFACWGNHDVSEKILAGFTFPQKGQLARDPRFEEFLKQADITMLEDETLLIDNAFYLIGRKDPDMAAKELDTRLSFSALTKDLDHALPILVIDHQPKELAEAQTAGVDLDLSGHTHGGQTFPASIFVHLLWENPSGIVRKGALTSAVTSGAGVWGPAMRILSNSEIMMLDVTFQAR